MFSRFSLYHQNHAIAFNLLVNMTSVVFCPQQMTRRFARAVWTATTCKFPCLFLFLFLSVMQPFEASCRDSVLRTEARLCDTTSGCGVHQISFLVKSQSLLPEIHAVRHRGTSYELTPQLAQYVLSWPSLTLSPH